ATMARYGTTALALNQWYFVAGVYNAATQTMDVYVNGVLDDGSLDGAVTSTQQNSTYNVDIGKRSGLSGFEFNGRIDEVRIYNRALAAGEIQTEMNAPVGSPEQLLGLAADGAGLPPLTNQEVQPLLDAAELRLQ